MGGGWGNRDVSFVASDPVAAAILGGGLPPTSINTSGLLGGLQLGYNWQFQPNFLLGFETDFDGPNIQGSGSSKNPATFGNPTGFVQERIDWFGTVRARLGWLPVNNLLAYVTGGFAYGQVEHNGSYAYQSGFGASASGGGFSAGCGFLQGLGDGQNCFVGHAKDTAVGWALGGGLEYAFSPRWSIRAEYLYVSLEGKALNEPTTYVPIPALTPGSINANFSHTNFSVARAGLNYRF